MSYSKKIEYEIVLKESFSVVRGCSKCGRKTAFINTKRFRVNANGNKLDVWLIYQCEKCKHTYNLPIYERQKSSAIPEKEYQSILNNDVQLAEMYGRNIPFLKKNKAEIDLESINYSFVKLRETQENGGIGEEVIITIHNSRQLKIRPEKQIAAVLGLSGSQVKKLVEQGEIKAEKSSPVLTTVRVSASLFYKE